MGKVLHRFKVAKHFLLKITENTLSVTRNEKRIAAEAALDAGIDPRLVDRMLTRTIHESDWEIRRLAAIPLALLAADGDAKARSRLSELGSDSVLPVAKFHSAALAALGRSGSVP